RPVGVQGDRARSRDAGQSPRGVPARRQERRAVDAVVPLFPVDRRKHHVQQDGAVAQYIGAVARLADAAASHGGAFRSMAVQAPEATGLLRRRERRIRPRSHAVLRSGLSQLERVRLRHRQSRERPRRRPLSHDGRRPAARRSAMARLRQGRRRLQEWQPVDGAGALERRRSMEGVRVRPARAGARGAGRSRSPAPPGRRLHEQLRDARAEGAARRHEMVAGVDALAAGRAALVGGARMSALTAALEGLRRVSRAPALLAGVWVLTFAISLPLAIVMRGMLADHLGRSLAADTALGGVNYEWMQEFASQASGVGVTFRPTIIGFGALLDNLSAFVDAAARPAVIVAAAAAYILVWLFLAGGIIDRLARD